MAKQAIGDDKSYSAWIRTQKIIRTIICVFLCFLSVIPFYVMVINATRAVSYTHLTLPTMAVV